MAKSRRVRHFGFVLPTVFLVAASCGPQNTTGQPSRGGGSESPSRPSREQSPASRVLAFTASKLGGGQVTGSEFQGTDLAIWFWAPW
jgi:hypothetical protein